MQYHIPKSTDCYRTTNTSPDPYAGNWVYVRTSKAVTYSESDIVEERKTETARPLASAASSYKVFRLPPAALPYRYLFVSARCIVELAGRRLNVVNPFGTYILGVRLPMGENT